MPYLIKQNFVPLESEMVNLQRYVHEDEPDRVSRGGYRGFKQSKDNFKAARLNPNEPITRKNPFLSVDKIRVCNSFQMSKKAMNQSICTLMQDDIGLVDDNNLDTAIAFKL